MLLIRTAISSSAIFLTAAFLSVFYTPENLMDSQNSFSHLSLLNYSDFGARFVGSDLLGSQLETEAPPVTESAEAQGKKKPKLALSEQATFYVIQA